MGVQLTKLCEGKELGLENLKGRIIAIDALNSLYAFLSTIRDRFTGEPLMDSQGRVTSHLSGLFYRSVKLVEAGLKPVYVFDGEPPAFKKTTTEARMKAKKEARAKWKEARERGDVEAIRKYAQATSKITDEMLDEAKTVLDAMGLPWVQAPNEAEAQCAAIVISGKAWCVGSSDYDSLLFGAKRLVRNLSITGKRKLPGKQVYVDVKPELIELDALLKSLKLTRKQLVIIGILVGTDYDPGGVRGIGPIKALELVRKEKTLDNVLKNVEWNFDIDAKEIVDFFLNPPVTNDYDIKWEKPKPEKIKKILCDEHNFSEERISKSINTLVKTSSQDSLSRWA